jgi:hypothetical protein
MNRAQKHQRGFAGTSFTKAVDQLCCVTMRPVVISRWNKQPTGAGSQA